MYSALPTSDRNKIRLRSELSWLEKGQALLEQEDFDGAFVFFRISFNSMYSIKPRLNNPPTDTSQYMEFFRNLLKYDSESTIYNALWSVFPGAIRTLVQNKYVFGLFWELQTTGSDTDWEIQLQRSGVKALAALGSKRQGKTLELLEIVLTDFTP